MTIFKLGGSVAAFLNITVTKSVIMSKRIVKETSRQAKVSERQPDVCDAGAALSVSQLQALRENGNRAAVKNYVETHYLGAAMQEWLMRTSDTELIAAYLNSHQNCGLFEDAEELLMSLNNNKLRKIYLEQWHLRQRSVMQLFAEKEFTLLRRYIAKHPEESFSRTMVFLMFEAGDKKLIRQYARFHPSIWEEERYAGKLQEFGLISPVSAIR